MSYVQLDVVICQRDHDNSNETIIHRSQNSSWKCCNWPLSSVRLGKRAQISYISMCHIAYSQLHTYVSLHYWCLLNFSQDRHAYEFSLYWCKSKTIQKIYVATQCSLQLRPNQVDCQIPVSRYLKRMRVDGHYSLLLQDVL